jgi:O-antigen/teichoic acid export membrane protein
MKSPMRGALLNSLVIQGLGSVAPFLTVILLARVGGPTIQGTFSTFKTWSDLVASIFVFGFPQAFVYLINKRLIGREALLNITLVYAALSVVILLPIALLSAYLSYNQVPSGRDLWVYSTLLGLGVAAVILNRLVRAIYLTLDDGVLFALITSAPATFVMITMLIASRQPDFDYDVAYLCAGLLTCLATGVWIRRIILASPRYRFSLPIVPIKALANQSLQTFFQSISFTIQPVITIALLLEFSATIIDVANFTAATIVIAAVNVFFGIISPILFNRWSIGMGRELFSMIGRIIDKTTLVFLLLGLLAIPAYPLLVPLVFGPTYQSAVPAFQIISLAIAPVAFTRTIASAIHAADRPGINSISCAVRLAVSVAVQVYISTIHAVDLVTAAVCAWVAAEWAAATYSWLARGTIFGTVKPT